MNGAVKRVREFLSYAPTAGSASPKGQTFYETADIALADVWELYKRDPTCKSSVDLLAASAVGMGFYTTFDEKYVKAAEAKAVVDGFCENVNLDQLLNDMAKRLLACGNDFWLKLSPTKLNDVLRLPIDAVEKVNLDSVSGFKLPYRVTGFKLRSSYVNVQGSSTQVLDPVGVIHWKLCGDVPNGFGVGLLQVLLHTLTIDGNKRPSYAWMKAKIERLMPKIFEKYAGPDVVVGLPGAKPETIQKFENAVKNRPEEGVWLFHGQKDANFNAVSIDPRAQGFTYYIDHMINQFYLGCETPLPRLFSTPGFTEASAKAAVELQDMLIKPVQRYVKRQVERELFSVVLLQADLDPVKAKARLNWGSPDTPEVLVSDLLAAAAQGLIRSDEFRKNAVKFGWELSDPDPKAPVSGQAPAVVAPGAPGSVPGPVPAAVAPEKVSGSNVGGNGGG